MGRRCVEERRKGSLEWPGKERRSKCAWKLQKNLAFVYSI